MQPKTFEIRDRATFIPAIALRLDPGTDRDRYLLARAGYGRLRSVQSGYILLSCNVSGGTDIIMNSDPNAWGGRTFPVAHRYIIEHWDELESGAVVDVEFIMGETVAPKQSEAAL